MFFHEILHTDVKWQYLKGDGARFSKKHFFPAKNAGNMPEKPVFWHFLEILSLVFSDFCTKMRFSNAQNKTESDLKKTFG